MATQTQTTTVQQPIFAPKPDTTRPVSQEPIRLYKDYLTPALHRRFTKAVGIVFAAVWFSAIAINGCHGGLIWSWFPAGPAGLRAVLLIIPCLAIFIVRIANLHIGEKTCASAAEEVYELAWRRVGRTLHTVAWYTFSGWFFGEYYLWQRGSSAELGLVLPYESFERPRLNENPIFLRSMFVTIGVTQAMKHLIWDYDCARIPLGREEDSGNRISESILVKRLGLSAEMAAKLPAVLRVLGERSGRMMLDAWNLNLVTAMMHIPIYFIFARRILWSFFYSVARMWFRELPTSAPPPGISDLHFGKLVLQVLVAPWILASLWQISNAVFTLYIAQPPTKKEEPLTSEIKDSRGVILHKSKDPNGSLLTGLRSKKEILKTFAFWELFLVTTKYDQRRKSLYTEVSRKDGSTWSQLCTQALHELQAVSIRIKSATEPLQYKTKQDEENLARQQHQGLIAYPPQHTHLPKIADRAVASDGDVFVKKQPDFVQTVGNLARSIGQSSDVQNPVTPRARRYIEYGADRMMSKEDQQRLSREHIHQQAEGYMVGALRTPAGEPFRQTFAKRVKQVVLGTPYSDRANIEHAARSLCELAIRSLKEDEYGQVQRDIARMVRVFTTTIKDIERYVTGLEPHWTDVAFTEEDRRVAEVQELLEVLKKCLQQIMLHFGEYADSLGLSKKEVREARETTGESAPSVALIGGRRRRPEGQVEQPEMQQVGNNDGETRGADARARQQGGYGNNY